MRVADLVCIGSQKAGTTWLHRMLAGHPQIFFSVFKEIHYFDTLYVPMQRNFQRRRRLRSQRILQHQIQRTPVHRIAAFALAEVLRHGAFRRYLQELNAASLLKDADINDDWYASFFREASDDRLTCDFTPAYALLPPEGIQHLRRLNPNARILYIVRNPIERALSHARMLIIRNGAPRTADSLREFLDRDAVRSHDDSVAVIRRWSRFWSRDQFRVLFHDDISARPLKLLSTVCDFAGVPFNRSYFPGSRKVIYAGPEIPVTSDLMAMLKDRYLPLILELSRQYPTETGSWLREPRQAWALLSPTLEFGP